MTARPNVPSSKIEPENSTKETFDEPAVLLIVGGDALLVPHLQQHFGWRLPTLSGDFKLSNETVSSHTNSRTETLEGSDGKP